MIAKGIVRKGPWDLGFEGRAGFPLWSKAAKAGKALGNTGTVSVGGTGAEAQEGQLYREGRTPYPGGVRAGGGSEQEREDP